ncbi:MAG: UDP-N-acetylmuramoyl-L-alanine--D-glutamate ligase [Planctomycetota bacterium]|nr:UDP-N-acetylmuramoyl-L-alanine--D-glutamate ligase [Planctomycetota bacterium]
MIPSAAKRCTVMGLGRFGGGLGVTRWLLDQGYTVCVTDLSGSDELTDSLAPLSDDIEAGRVRLQLGSHELSDFTDTDLVIANPAVPQPWDNSWLQAASNQGVPISTEIRLLVEQLDRSRVIGVTGTNGKSTTTAMIHHILIRCGLDARLGGNIGGSLLSTINDVTPNTWFVLELSSAMLYWLGDEHGDQGWSPGTAVITNIAPNHIDWHGSEAHYRQCKENITRWQTDEDMVLRGESVARSTPIPIRLPGAHNQANAHLAVMVVSKATDITPAQAATALSDFPGLPHRLEPVGTDGRFFNDSKSTTPEATVLAVQAFAPKCSRVHLIAGGYDKGVSLDAIAALSTEIGGLYTIGTTGPNLAEQATGQVVSCGDLETAVNKAFQNMGPGDILLLSPGCASWDQFEHFEARGEAFRSLVSAHSGTMGSDRIAPTNSLSEPTP